MITLDVLDKRLRLRAVPDTECFEKHRNLLLELTDKDAIYDGDDFVCWALPLDSIASVFERFDISSISATPGGQALIQEYTVQLMSPTEVAPQELKVARADGLPLKPFQIPYVCINENKDKLLCAWDTGLGKCEKIGTLVLKYDGTLVPVENVRIGDLLMGPDSLPRKVVATISGREQLYKVTPVKGISYEFTGDHILSLKTSGPRRRKSLGDYTEMSVIDYMNASRRFRHETKVWRSGAINFPYSQPTHVNPYFLGIWLGDGNSLDTGVTSADPEIGQFVREYAEEMGLRLSVRDTTSEKTKRYHIVSQLGDHQNNRLLDLLRSYNVVGNKHIPLPYLTSTIENRKQLLAGLIDTDGYIVDGCCQIIQKRERLANDIAFLCRSLGLAAYVQPVVKSAHKDHSDTYHSVNISGDLSDIPVLLRRKQAAGRIQTKNVLVTGIKSIEPSTVDEYYGFKVEGPDSLFLLGDFTVTHNCTGSLMRALQLGFTKLVIVGPKCTMTNWEEEIRRNIGSRNVLSYTGDTVKKKRLALHNTFSGVDIFCVNYEMLDELCDALKEQKIKVQQVIIDEAHLVSRRGKVRNKNAKKLIKQYKNAGLQLLSGTPILKTVEDLYELVWMCSPRIAGSRNDWLKRFQEVVYSEQRSKVIGKGTNYEKVIYFDVDLIKNPVNLEECHKKIRSILVKVDRKDITDFADFTEVVRVPVTGHQMDLYRQAAQEVLIEWKTGQLPITNVLTRMLRLLQIAEGAFNIDETSLESGKLEYIKHVLENTEEKIIVWSRFKPVTEILYGLYKDKAVLYNGDVNEKDKTLAKFAFQGGLSEDEELMWHKYRGKLPIGEASGKPIHYKPKYNGHIKAPGEAQFFFGTLDFRSSIGINLHNACSRQIFSSFHFNGGVNEQAKSRLTRLGQSAEQVVTTFLVSQGTIEPDALALVLDRFEKQQQVISGNFEAEESLSQVLMRKIERQMKNG